MLRRLKAEYPKLRGLHDDWAASAIEGLLRAPVPPADDLSGYAISKVRTIARDQIRKTKRRNVARVSNERGIAMGIMGDAETEEPTTEGFLAALKRRTYEQLLEEFAKIRGREWQPLLTPRVDLTQSSETLELERRSIKALNALRGVAREIKAIHNRVEFGEFDVEVGVATNAIVRVFHPAIARQSDITMLTMGDEIEVAAVRINEVLMAEPRQKFAYAYIRDRMMAGLFIEVASGEREMPEITSFRRDALLDEAPTVEVTVRELAVAWLLAGAPCPFDEADAWSTWPEWSAKPDWAAMTPSMVIKQATEGFKKVEIGAKAVAEKAIELATKKPGEEIV